MAEARDDDKGVLGSLPSRRPGVESPRRAEARQAAAQGAAETRERRPAAEEAGGGPTGLEELARAGAGLATGAAAAGLKLAGRAAGGLGRVVGRR
ncbi:MAG: hypothetical protein AABM29_04275 [Actinomycetota bacterium]